MRKVSLNKAKPGTVLARPVFGLNGQILLNAGAKLKQQYINNLALMGFNSVYVKDNRLEDVSCEEPVSERTRQEGYTVLKNVFDGLLKGDKNYRSLIRMENSILDIVSRLIDEIDFNRDLLNPLDIKSMNNYYYYEHSINVAILSIVAALNTGMPLNRIKRDAPGLLLFDIGNIKVPPHILMKRGPLSGNEYEIIRKHPVYGDQVIKKSKLFTGTARKIISQHHERNNGSGYPKGLKEKDINHLAQIAAVADVYDALISERPYRKAMLPDEALKELSCMEETGLNMGLVKVFYNFVAAYPLGTHVMLSNGMSGLVSANTPGSPACPTVRVFYEGEQLIPVSSPYEINLSEKEDVVIKKVIKEEEPGQAYPSSGLNIGFNNDFLKNLRFETL